MLFIILQSTKLVVSNYLIYKLSTKIMKLIQISALLFTISCTGLVAQETTPNVTTKANFVGQVDGVVHISSIASRMSELTPAIIVKGEVQDKRSQGNTVIIGKDKQTEDDYFVRNRHDAEQSIDVRSTLLSFDAYASGSSPSDPAMAVGPNHILSVFNTGFAIHDKSGNVLVNPTAPNPAIFPSGGCCDLTAAYDNVADRWVLSFLGNGAQIAVSDGPNPVTSGWYVYTINQINDYQKLSIWSDGYYMTDNAGTTKLWALERDEMLLGNAGAQILGFSLPGIVTSGFSSPQVLSISDDTQPAVGGATVVYMQDNAWGGVATDHMKIWTVDVNWGAGSGTVSAATQIPLAPFIGVFDGGSFSNLAQPAGGSSIDALQATVMNQAQFRKFPTYNSALCNFVVDTDGGPGKLAGVRWMEFRQTADNQPWTLYQEGTYTAPDGRHAWCASLIMDGSGNIGMGYSSMSGPSTPTTTYVGSYYTGRFSGDPLGVMTVSEGLIAAGTGNINGTRYGDYNKICIDPSDDATFWFIDEYVNGGQTRGVVGAFILDVPLPDDLGVTAITSPNPGLLSATENVTVDIRNFGVNDITNPNVQFTIDGGAPVIETYSGTISAGAVVSYAFTTTADLSSNGTTYSICAKTNLGGDSNVGNDEFCKDVSNEILFCLPTSDCSFGDGITKVILGTIVNNNISCGTGYDDFTTMSTTLNQGENANMTVRTGYDAITELSSMWIDFNDDGSFAGSEQLFSDVVVNPDGVDVMIPFTIPANAQIGSHRMRLRAGDTGYPGNLNDPCDPMQYGTTHDYTVNIDAFSSVGKISLENSQMALYTLGNDLYDVSFVTDYSGTVSIAIYNAAGQIVAFNNLEKEGDRFNYHLDMSYAANGVYIIKMGDLSKGIFETKKIIVD